jgi:phospholipid-binding lipoprotein MlaA
MKFLGVFAMAIGLMTASLLTPAWSAPTQPLPDFFVNPSDTEVIYLSQQEAVNNETTDDQKEAEEDLWEDDDMSSEDDEEELTIADPLYYVNKGIWHFNDVVYVYVGEPAARGYNWLLPETMRGGVVNFFRNWTMPARMISCLLQAKWEQAGTEVGRFLINSTLGILGFADLAKEEEWTGWEMADEDIGQAFGAWGMGHGFYLVLPLLGPSSGRDGAGFVGDTLLDPLTWVDIHTWERMAISGYRGFAYYAPYEGEYTKFKEMSLDPYTAMRNAYIQYRARKVRE